MFFYILLVLILCVSIFVIYQRNNRFYILVNKIPGPPSYPILGSLLTYNVSVEKQWNRVREVSNKYGPIYRVWMGPTHAIVSIIDPDDIEILLSNQKYIGKGCSYDLLHPWLKSGLLTSDGTKWRQRRKMLTPAFHFNILKKYMDITNENGIRFIETLKAEGDRPVANLLNLCSNYTLNIVLESAMGVALDKIDKQVADGYKTAIQDNGLMVVYRLVRPYIRNWMMDTILWKLGRIQRRALKTLADFSNNVVQERREYHERTQNKFLISATDDMNNPDEEEYVYASGRKRMAMLDLLLSAEQEGMIDNDGILEEIDAFAVAGYDTTAVTMTFALTLLAHDKEAQSIARAEVTDIMNKNQGRLGMTETQELNYLERVIKETLRLYPPVATISRAATEDIQFKNYLVPAGAEVWMHLYDTHHSPKYWEDPDKFDPDRFLPERIQGRHPFSYIPFSGGPRNCIGQKFALMELKSLLGRILYNFELEPTRPFSEMEILLDIVIRPIKPVSLRFIRINH